MTSTLQDLRAECFGHVRSPAYIKKMLHAIPAGKSVDRVEWLLQHCVKETVLHVGASGPLHDNLLAFAAKVYGIDRDDGPDIVGFDLDDVTKTELPAFPGITRVVCGEVLEHLSNPGWFLTRLKRQYGGIPTYISVPNAFSTIAAGHLRRGLENVNLDHTCWYSWKTLTTLLERAGYVVQELAWYNGAPYVAEGLIVVTE